MATQGNDGIRKARSVHWASDIEKGSPKPKPKRGATTKRHNRRNAPLEKRPITVIHRFGLVPPTVAARPDLAGRRVEVLERQPEPIQMCRCNRPLAISIAGILLFSAVGVACILLRFYSKI